MGPGDFLAFIATLATVIVVSILVLNGHRHRLRFRERQLELTAAQAADEGARNGAPVAELAERVRVLERIVTDRGYDVATQIEALRDARRTAATLDEHEKELG